MSGIDIIMIGVIITLVGCIKVIADSKPPVQVEKYVPAVITIDTERYLP